MRTAVRVVGWFAAMTPIIAALGHGVPVNVDVVENRLTISNGFVDDAGFAPMLFADGSEDGQLEHVFVPGFGNVGLTNLPGLNIQGMEPESGLYLEVIPRPVQNSSPTEHRLLWHWSDDSEMVQLAPNGESLTIATEFGRISVPQTGTPVPPPLQIARPTADDIGQHVHFLRYLLDDDPSAAGGAYGFFARLSSPSYNASGPMLVVLNNGLEESDLLAAALAINAAAADSLPGDYNGNGTVDAADYTVWRDTLGSETMLAADGSGNLAVDQDDYEVWQGQFGQTANGSAGSAVAIRTPTTVPEPATIGLLVWLLAGAATFRRGIVAPAKSPRKPAGSPQRARRAGFGGFRPHFAGPCPHSPLDSLPVIKLF